MAVDTASSIVIRKHFNYRGTTKEWSNRYHVTGPTTLTLAEFEVLADAIVADEADIYEAGYVTIDEAVWYDASTATPTNPHGIAAFTKPYATPGTQSFINWLYVPGDCAVVGRWSTDARSIKNHPIYLFKFWHGVGADSSATIDTVNAGQASQINEYGADWLAGFSDGTNTRVLCGPRGAVAQVFHQLPYIRHRDFPT